MTEMACTRRANCPCAECVEAMAAMADFMPQKPALVHDYEPSAKVETAPPSPASPKDTENNIVEQSEDVGDEGVDGDKGLTLDADTVDDEPAEDLIVEPVDEEDHVEETIAVEEGGAAAGTEDVTDLGEAVEMVAGVAGVVVEVEANAEVQIMKQIPIHAEVLESKVEQEEVTSLISGEVIGRSGESSAQNEGGLVHSSLAAGIMEDTEGESLAIAEELSRSLDDGGTYGSDEDDNAGDDLFLEAHELEESNEAEAETVPMEPFKEDAIVEGDNSLGVAEQSEVLISQVALEMPIKAGASKAESAPAGVESSAEVAISKGGRRRRRVSGGLGMMDAYSNQDNAPKYSQKEVDALVAAKLEESKRAEEDIRKQYEGQMAVMQSMLTAAQQEVAQANTNAAKSDEQESLILELSQRLEEFESTHVTKLLVAEKELTDKKIQLDAITQQYMGMKTELVTQEGILRQERERFSLEMEAVQRDLAARGEDLRKLQDDFDSLQAVEREKRTAAVLKMKHDMKELAEKQFGEANKLYRALQRKLKDTCEELAMAKSEAAGAAKREAALLQSVEKAKEAEEAVRVATRDELAAINAKYVASASEVEKLKVDMTAKERELTIIAKSADDAKKDRQAAQDSLARMAVRNNELQNEVAELKEVSEQLLSLVEGK